MDPLLGELPGQAAILLRERGALSKDDWRALGALLSFENCELGVVTHLSPSTWEAEARGS